MKKAILFKRILCFVLMFAMIMTNISYGSFAEGVGDVNLYDAEGYNSAGFDANGYNRQGFDASGYNAQGFDASGYDRAGFDASGIDREGYNTAGFNASGYNRQGFNASGYNAQGYDVYGFDVNGIDAEGYNTLGFNASGYNRQGFNASGYNAQGYDVYGFDVNGIDAEGYNTLGFGADGYNRQGFNASGYNAQGYDVYGFDVNGIDAEGYNTLGFGADGYNRQGFDATGYNAQGYDVNGFDVNGIDAEGYNTLGFGADGYNRQGFDATGYNAQGYDVNGFDVNGIDAEGYNTLGFNASGYNRQGFDANGYNAQGYDVNGFDINGYNAEGYNAYGYNAAGYDKDGYDINNLDANGISKYDENGFDVNGYDVNGFDKDGYNVDGYDVNGFDKDGYNVDGYDVNGFDKDGYNIDGYDVNGFDKDGYNVDGYDVNGYNKDGYDINGYDVNGFDKDGFDVDGFDVDGYDKDGLDINGDKKPDEDLSLSATYDLLDISNRNSSHYSDTFVNDYKKNPFFYVTFRNVGNDPNNDVVVAFYENSTVAYPSTGVSPLAVDDYNFLGFSRTQSNPYIIDISSANYSVVSYEKILSGETTVNNFIYFAVYEEPTFTEGDDKKFTINYYYEGGTEKAHPSDEIIMSKDDANFSHQLPTVSGATVTNGKTNITLKYNNDNLVRNIYYTKDAQTNATVKVNLEFVNANGNTVTESFKFELPVGSLTSADVSQVLAMTDIANYISKKNVVNNSTKDDNLKSLVVLPNDSDGSHNSNNFLGTIKLNKVEYQVDIFNANNRYHDNFEKIHGATFTTPMPSDIGLQDVGTDVTWSIINTDDNTSFEVASGATVTVKSNIEAKPIIKHTVTYLDGDGKVLGTEKVSHQFAGTLNPPSVPAYNYREFLKWDSTGTTAYVDINNNITFGHISAPTSFKATYKSTVSSTALPIATAISSYTRPFNNTKVTMSELGINLVSVDGNTTYTLGVDYDVTFYDNTNNYQGDLPKIKNVSGNNGSRQIVYQIELNTTSTNSAFYGLGAYPSSGNNNTYSGSIDFTITPIEFTITLGDMSVPVGTSLSQTSIDASVQSQIDAALANTGIKDTAYAKDLGDMTLSYLQTLVNTAGTYHNAIGLELLKKGKTTIDGDTYKFNKSNYKITFIHGDLTVYNPTVTTPTTTPTTEETTLSPVLADASASVLALPAPAPVANTEQETTDETVEIEDNQTPQAPAPTTETEDETVEIEDTQAPTAATPENDQNYLWIWILGLLLAGCGITIFAVKKKKSENAQ